MTADLRLQGVMAQVKDGRLEEAIETLLAMVEEDDTNVDALVVLGGCYGKLGQYLEAEHYLSMACELDGTNAQAHYYLGQVFQARGRIEMAVRSYENALRCNIKFERAWKALLSLKVTLSPDLQAAGVEHGFVVPEEHHAPPVPGDPPA